MAEFITGMNSLLALFLIAALGYLIGAIKVKGIELGTAGVLLVALVFGHFGCEMPALIRNVGLALFVTSVGFIAGPKFFRNFKQNAKSYILLGFIIILTGALTCALLIAVSGVQPELMVGLMTGALTSTPGLAAAQGAAGELSAQAAKRTNFPFRPLLRSSPRSSIIVGGTLFFKGDISYGRVCHRP